MGWNTTWPDGSISVKDNKLKGIENTTYIGTTLNLDHYWGVDPKKDGHHKQIQMTQTGVTGAPLNVALLAEMEGALFVKNKTVAESPSHRDANLYYLNNATAGTPGATNLAQMLGIRAMGHFSVSGAGFTVATQYVHNINPSTVIPPLLCGIKRDDIGQYSVTFANSLPSSNYLVLGGAHASSGDAANQWFSVKSGGALNVKTTSGFKFTILTTNIKVADPLQCWFICFGG